MSVIYALWLRELRRYVRSRAQVVASLGQPLLYLLGLGFGMGPVFQKAGMGNYRQFVAPGIIAMTILFSSIFSGAGLIFDRQFGFLKETLVAPVPRIYVMLGRTLGAATVAVMQSLLVAVVCVICGFRPVDYRLIPVALLFMALIASLFSSFGTAIGSSLQNIQGFQMIMSFLVMPIFFLSGALYPLNNLPTALNVVVTLDPLAYGVDSLRSLLIGTSHFGLMTDATVLLAVSAVALLVGSRLFSKIQI
jgi:ABC-2 type transport system permease protein